MGRRVALVLSLGLLACGGRSVGGESENESEAESESSASTTDATDSNAESEVSSDGNNDGDGNMPEDDAEKLRGVNVEV